PQTKNAARRRHFLISWQAGSVELGLDLAQRRLEQRGAGAGLDLVGEQLAGGLDGDVDGAAAHLGHRVALGLGDLLLGQRRAARDIVLALLLGFGDQRARLALGGGDDVARLLLGFLALALVLGQQLLRLVTQAPRLVEIVADALGAGVERLAHCRRRAEIDDEGEEEDEADKGPECSVHSLTPLPPSRPRRPSPCRRRSRSARARSNRRSPRRSGRRRAWRRP